MKNHIAVDFGDKPAQTAITLTIPGLYRRGDVITVDPYRYRVVDVDATAKILLLKRLRWWERVWWSIRRWL